MTSISLHPTPSTRAVLGEQFRAVGLALRKETIFFICALIALGVLMIGNMARAAQAHPGGNWHTGFGYGAPAAIPMIMVAFLIPFGVWKSEDPSRRAYHWSMPVARGPHTIMKLVAGWLWLMMAVVAYLVFIVILATATAKITGEVPRLGEAAGWEWVVAFTAPTLAYLLTSIAVIGSNHAWRWLGGLYIGYWVLIGACISFGMPDVGYAIRKITDGPYGLNAALVGSASNATQAMPGEVLVQIQSLQMGHWLIAMPLWIIGAAIAVTIVSYRHQE